MNITEQEYSPVILTIEDGNDCSKTVTKTEIKNCEELKPDFSWEYIVTDKAIRFIDISQAETFAEGYTLIWKFDHKISSIDEQPLIAVSSETKNLLAELTIVNKQGCSKTTVKKIFFEGELNHE